MAKPKKTNLLSRIRQLSRLKLGLLAVVAVLVLGGGYGAFLFIQKPTQPATVEESYKQGLQSDEATTGIKASDPSATFEIDDTPPPVDTVTDEGKSAWVALNFIDWGGWKYGRTETNYDIPTLNKTGRHAPVDLLVESENVKLSDCSIAHKYVPDDSWEPTTSQTLSAKASQPLDLYDGDHSFTIKCSTGGKQLEANKIVRVYDQLPEQCRDFQFTAGTVDNSNLKSGIVGVWEGCTSQFSFWPPTYVRIEFRSDGSYSAVSNEVLDGLNMWGVIGYSDDDHSDKTYIVNNSDSAGTLYIPAMHSNVVVSKPLNNIKLMGNKLSFDLYYSSSAATYRLERK
jgi:hypothetical protein